MRLKWVCGAGLLVALAIMGDCIILLSYDYDALKPKISRVVKEETGRDLTLGGAAAIKAGFSSSLVVEDEAGPSSGARDRLFSRKPLSFKMLYLFDAVVRYRAQQVVLLPRLALSDMDFNLQLKRGSLKAEPVHFIIGGGAFDGRMELCLDGEEESMWVDFKVNHFDVGRMLKELELNGGIEGRIAADVTLNSRGDRWRNS